MHVVATAGHVDHGKSTLVRALTGMEPDRWAEERRRGLTIDLGYAWTNLPGVGDVAFVDVPGHRRFIGNMLAGLGPSPAVLLVVAADEGWRAQTEEHLRAVEAMRLRHGLVVVTRSDLADPATAMAEALARVAEGPLGGDGPGGVAAVAVSAVTGEGLPQLREALTALCSSLPAPPADRRVRLWVDRAFSVRGAGTVVTGTLEAGAVAVGDTLALVHRSPDGSTSRSTPVGVRGLQTLGRPVDRISGAARVAVNLRGVPVEQVERGDALLTPDAWPLPAQLDVRLDVPAADLPLEQTLHVGTAALPVRVRPLAGRAARLTVTRGLPLQAGDRAILRVPGVEGSVTGLAVLDVAPPRLTRRGSAARRGEQLLAEELTGEAAPGAAGPTAGPHADPRSALVTEVLRRGHLDLPTARLLGHDVGDLGTGPADRVVRAGDHLLSEEVWADWQGRLVAAVDAHASAHPLDPFLPVDAARRAAGLPDRAVVAEVAGAAGLAVAGGAVSRPGTRPSLGAAQEGLDAVVARLTDDPFAAPEADDLTGLGLGRREIAAAVATGQLLRLGEEVLLLPRAPAQAMAVLARLDQPFTTSAARQALGTTRRVAIPLLEHLDARGWTRRVDAGHRVVVR